MWTAHDGRRPGMAIRGTKFMALRRGFHPRDPHQIKLRVSIDNDDAPKSGFDFTISNTVAGTSNNADWRCQPFLLEPAAGSARPIAFSFAYKFLEAVANGNNVHVQLRFFDSTGTNFISEIVLPVGAHTGDSRMGIMTALQVDGPSISRP
jgi:hypothetical protein